MNNLRTFLLFTLLTFVANVYGDQLKVTDFIINQDKTLDVSVELENSDYQYIMLDFKMVLPAGVELAQDGNGKYQFTNSDRFKSTHTMTVSKDAIGNVYHFLIYSSTNEALNGNAGELFKVTLKASADAVSGNYQGKITNQIFSDENRNGHIPSDVAFNVSILHLYSVSITSDNLEYGTVSLSPSNDDGYLENSTLSATATPAEGCHFVKWSDETTDNPYNITVNGDINLSALFALNQYNMTFVLGNGQPDMVLPKDYKSALSAPEAPTREGFTFNGWTPAIPSSVPAQDMTFTAQWERNNYTVKFIVDGEVYSQNSLPYESAITPPAAPDKEGYTFTGWDAEVPATMPASDLTFTAQYIINTYNVIYIVNGEEWTREQVTYGEPIVLREYPAEEGFTFSGWLSDAEYTNMPSHDVVYTAQLTTGISTISADTPVDVYNIQGTLMHKQLPASQMSKILPKGIYIVNGQKVILK